MDKRTKTWIEFLFFAAMGGLAAYYLWQLPDDAPLTTQAISMLTSLIIWLKAGQVWRKL